MNNQTVNSIAIPPFINNIVKPEFIRLPKPGTQCIYTGLSRSGMSSLVLGDNPPVKSVTLRNKGSERGVRLINYDSLIKYLRSQAVADE